MKSKYYSKWTPALIDQVNFEANFVKLNYHVCARLCARLRVYWCTEVISAIKRVPTPSPSINVVWVCEISLQHHPTLILGEGGFSSIVVWVKYYGQGCLSFNTFRVIFWVHLKRLITHWNTIRHIFWDVHSLWWCFYFIFELKFKFKDLNLNLKMK